MIEHPVVGLDLGGTQIKGLLLDDAGKVHARATWPSEADQGSDHGIARMSQLVRHLVAEVDLSVDHLAGVGVGTPGPLELTGGRIIRTANLPGWTNVPLRDLLAQQLGTSVVMLNDASAAAYGEYWLGAGQGVEDLALLTLGTGVGGGVISSGQVIVGHFDNAAELGHVIFMPGGRACRCGQRGCVEAYAGRQGILDEIRLRLSNGSTSLLSSKIDDLDVADVVAAVEAGDAIAEAVWDEACRAVAIACVNLQHTFNPQRILLGGGVAGARATLLDRVIACFRENTWTLAADAPEIILAQLGNDAGATGAAGWFLHTHART